MYVFVCYYDADVDVDVNIDIDMDVDVQRRQFLKQEDLNARLGCIDIKY